MQRWRHELDRALAETSPHAFAFRRSAACLWGLDGFTPGATGFTGHPEVAVAYPRTGRVAVPRLKHLQPADLAAIDGVAVTAVHRLLADLGTLRDADLLERAVECALRHELIDEVAVRALAAQRAVRGVPTLRVVVQRRPLSAPPTESDLETLTLQLCRNGGVPVPDRQVRCVPGRLWRSDLAWPLWRVALEADGRASHGPERFTSDRRRQNETLLGGWMVLRFTWDDVTKAPARTLDVIRRALRSRGCPC